MKRTAVITALSLVLLVGIILLRPKPIQSPDGPPGKIAESEGAVPEDAPKPVPKVTEEPKGGAIDRSDLLSQIAEALRNQDKDALKALMAELKAMVVPPDVADEDNAALLYKEAFAHISEFEGREAEVWDKALEGKELSPEDLDVLRLWRSKNAETFRLLRQAAGRPECRFPLDFDQGFAMELPHVPDMIRACRMLKVESMILRADGLPGDASQSNLAALAMADHLRKEPILVSQLVGVVIDGISLTEMEHANIGDAGELSRFIEETDPAMLHSTYQKSLLTEVHAVLRYLDDWEEMGENFYGEGSGMVMPQPMPEDIAYYVEWMSEIMEASALPYPEAGPRLEEIFLQRHGRAPWYAEFSRRVMPAVSKSTQHIAKSESRHTMAKVVMQLERYKTMNGAYPETLDALPDVPLDPYTGSTYDYDRDANGFVIQSPDADPKENDGLIWRRQN